MVRKARMTVYINPQSSQQLTDVAGYTLADGSPAIDVVCLFAGNYASPDPPYLRANNNQPETNQPFNPNIQQVLGDGSVQYLQSKGLKVLLTVTNGWATVGWSTFTVQTDAMDFAQYLKSVVDQYGLDGIDIDDEYSIGAANDTSLIMVTTLMREIMPGKIISKALYSDLNYFASSWNGNTLAGNLDFGAEMSYGSPANGRLAPYLGYGMGPPKLSLGFWSAQPSPAPGEDVAWLVGNGYAGVMMYAFEEQANVDYMGELVNDWFGSGNWNPPRK
jgi:hypothetical protein